MEQSNKKSIKINFDNQQPIEPAIIKVQKHNIKEMDKIQETKEFKNMVEANKKMEERVNTAETTNTNNGPNGMVFEDNLVDFDKVKEKLLRQDMSQETKQPTSSCDNSNYDFNKDIRSYNVGNSDYSQHKIQPWDIWEDYNLNPWDADIVKRVLRRKGLPGLTDTQSRIEDYNKIIHICLKRIQQLQDNINID